MGLDTWEGRVLAPGPVHPVPMAAAQTTLTKSVLNASHNFSPLEASAGVTEDLELLRV